MLIKLNEFEVPLKLVYQLSEQLKIDAKQILQTQTLTLDESRPFLGLKGTHGLFASEEWWDNIYHNRMPVHYVSGTIKRAYVAGQDYSHYNNTVEVISTGGDVITTGIYTQHKQHIKLFKEGATVAFVYVLDELKQQPTRDGSVNYSKIVLEMAVSI